MEPELDGKVPSFIDSKVAVEESPYPGAPDAIPTFDYELNALPTDVEQKPTAYAGRWSLIARMHVLGQTNIAIARAVGYTPVGVGLVLRNPWTQTEIARLRRHFDDDFMVQVKEATTDSVRYLRSTVNDDAVKDEIRSANARWFVEKQTGKPKQEVAVEHGGLVAYLDIMKEMQRRGEPLDVTPLPAALPEAESSADTPPKTADRFDTWLDEHLR